MSSVYRIDCKKWATEKLKDPHFEGKAKLVTIQPKSGKVLGGVKVPNGKIEYPNWHYHYAVEYKDKMYDEAYKNGIATRDFKKRFIYADAIKYSY